MLQRVRFYKPANQTNQRKDMNFQNNSGAGKPLLPTGFTLQNNGKVKTQKERPVQSSQKDKEKVQSNRNANSDAGEVLLPTGLKRG